MPAPVKTESAKSLGDPVVRRARFDQLNDAHIEPLTRFVEELRVRAGSRAAIPYFDPWDGGVNAEVLFLLEAPGPQAVRAGFVSRDNPDETAKNFLLLNRDAGIARERTVCWNIVPWYIGTGVKIRPAKHSDIAEGVASLSELFRLLTDLTAVVLVGKKASTARSSIELLRPAVRIFETPHPSPLFVNNRPENRSRLLTALGEVAAHLQASTTRAAEP